MLNDYVSSHAEDEEDDGGDDLGENADPGGVGDEGKEEAHGLPEPVVGEGGLLVVGKETTIEGIDLGLPDCVSDPPEGGQEIDDSKGALGWSPGQHHDDHQGIEAGAQDEDGQPAHLLDDESEANGGKSVTNSKENKNTTNCVDTVCARHKALQR